MALLSVGGEFQRLWGGRFLLQLCSISLDIGCDLQEALCGHQEHFTVIERINRVNAWTEQGISLSLWGSYAQVTDLCLPCFACGHTSSCSSWGDGLVFSSSSTIRSPVRTPSARAIFASSDKVILLVFRFQYRLSNAGVTCALSIS